MTTAQMISKYEDAREYKTKVLQSQDVNEVYAFLQKNCTTAGFSIQYGIAGDKVFKLFKTGKLGKREIKKLVEEKGITEWHYSWCWASDKWLVNGNAVTAVEIDLTPVKTLQTAWQYRNVL